MSPPAFRSTPVTMSSSPSTHRDSANRNQSPSHIHYEQRRVGHICAILVRNLSLRPTRDRALQTLTSQRPGGSYRYHTTSDDADLTLSLARSNSRGKGIAADGSHRRRRSASWSRHGAGSSDEDQEEGSRLDTGSASASSPLSRSQLSSKSRLDAKIDRRGRSALLANHRRTSDHELTTSSSLSSSADGIYSEVSPRPILKRSSSTRDGRDARMQAGSPGAATSSSNFLDELGANTTMLSRSDSRSSSHSSHTIRRPSYRARTTSMASSSSVRSVRFDESHVGAADEARRPSRISGRLNASSRYLLFSQKSLGQIMQDRMLECYVELSLGPNSPEVAERSGQKGQASTIQGSQREHVFYRTPNSKSGLHHSWGYQGGDPITPERDFLGLAGASASAASLEASTLHVKVWARSPQGVASDGDTHASSSTSKREEEGWKPVCQTRVDLRDLEPVAGNLQDASLSLPPNSILLGLAPGANSLSGRAHLASSDSPTVLDGASSDGAKKGPALTRKVSEREAERTRHILESIIYYAVPLESAHQGGTGQDVADELNQSWVRSSTIDATGKHGRRDVSLSRSPTRPRRASVEGYAFDPENAPNRKRTPEQSEATPSNASNSASVTVAAAAATPDARRRERRKAFEDEQRRALELSLRETKMMPSYTLDEARQLARKQAELHDLLEEVGELRQDNGALLHDPEGAVQLRLKREQQMTRYEAVRQMAIDEVDDLKRRRDELEKRKAAITARRDAIEASQALFDAAEARSRKLGEQVHGLKAEKEDVALHVHSLQASLLRDLEAIFPIELSDASSLLFSVCGLPLPNAVASLPPSELSHEEKRWKETVKRHAPASTRPVFHPFDDDTVSSAFGLVAQLVVLLSTYLATPIHYPLATAGSRAVVQDGISLMSGPRAFPLYAKGMERYRYEYAAFLLNKDIEQLMNVHSVTVIDIRHTLPNLKNLMVTVAAAPPTSQLTRKSHIGKTEIALRSATSSLSLSQTRPEEPEANANGAVKKPGMGLGLGLPNLNAAVTQSPKAEATPDTLVTTRVLGAPSKPTATPATASGAIASVSRAFSYFSGSTR